MWPGHGATFWEGCPGQLCLCSEQAVWPWGHGNVCVCCWWGATPNGFLVFPEILALVISGEHEMCANPIRIAHGSFPVTTGVPVSWSSSCTLAEVWSWRVWQSNVTCGSILLAHSDKSGECAWLCTWKCIHLLNFIAFQGIFPDNRHYEIFNSAPRVLFTEYLLDAFSEGYFF